jgi:6,7-dimethyl-8-ribityllumazine synthase
MPKVLIIEARFYDHIADGLLAGAKAALEKGGATCEVLTVPGIYELPAALEMAVASGRGYDGYVTLGCAIRGETDHYHHICAACVTGLSELAVAHRLALGNGVLTVHNEAQALARSEPSRKDIGGQAGRACLRMMELRRRMAG